MKARVVAEWWQDLTGGGRCREARGEWRTGDCAGEGEATEERIWETAEGRREKVLGRGHRGEGVGTEGRGAGGRGCQRTNRLPPLLCPATKQFIRWSSRLNRAV